MKLDGQYLLFIIYLAVQIFQSLTKVYPQEKRSFIDGPNKNLEGVNFLSPHRGEILCR